MNISATVINQGTQHQTFVRTNDQEQSLPISAKTTGLGSSINGGELLFLALATCYCNDLYREAKDRGLTVESVKVEATGSFGRKGEPAQSISYRASVKAQAEKDEVLDLMRHTDTVAEIQNTLRLAIPVVLTACEVIETKSEG